MSDSFDHPLELHYDEVTNTSKDFVIVARYATPVLSWEVDWCDSNKVFIWHKDCNTISVLVFRINIYKLMDGSLGENRSNSRSYCENFQRRIPSIKNEYMRHIKAEMV